MYVVYLLYKLFYHETLKVGLKPDVKAKKEYLQGLFEWVSVVLAFGIQCGLREEMAHCSSAFRRVPMHLKCFFFPLIALVLNCKKLRNLCGFNAKFESLHDIVC